MFRGLFRVWGPGGLLRPTSIDAGMASSTVWKGNICDETYEICKIYAMKYIWWWGPGGPPPSMLACPPPPSGKEIYVKSGGPLDPPIRDLLTLPFNGPQFYCRI